MHGADFALQIDNCAGGGAAFTARFDAIRASGKKLMIENSNQGFGNPRQEGGLSSSNLTSWASSNCSHEGVGADSACPGCNNSFVKSSQNNPQGCGRGVRTAACPYSLGPAYEYI